MVDKLAKMTVLSNERYQLTHCDHEASNKILQRSLLDKLTQMADFSNGRCQLNHPDHSTKIIFDNVRYKITI